MEEIKKCCMCNAEIKGAGNNPEPLADSEQSCCVDCYNSFVIPAKEGTLGDTLITTPNGRIIYKGVLWIMSKKYSRK